ncbi:MAG TPA: nucleotidyltransferase domain-containing protein [Thermoanaerobacterales bacterium]|nr:nucleotidyltransferase domain-containing protein [Thermoanaerobacterales bacterium]
MVDYEEIEKIKKELIKKFQPTRIILFGSQAKGIAKLSSDIDLCVIINTDNKRSLLAEIYSEIDSRKPFDVIVYTPGEWEKFKNREGTFAHLINEKGVTLYG